MNQIIGEIRREVGKVILGKDDAIAKGADGHAVRRPCLCLKTCPAPEKRRWRSPSARRWDSTISAFSLLRTRSRRT